MRQSEYHACLIGCVGVMLAKFVYLPGIGNNQEAGEIVFVRFDTFLKDFHSVAFCRCLRADGCMSFQIVLFDDFSAAGGIFTYGLERFDKAVADGTIYKVVTTNLTYQTPELLSRPYYINCDMSKYIAYIIDTLNHDSSISDLLNPYDRIQKLVSKYKKEHK